jgi:hypothetical protein
MTRRKYFILASLLLTGCAANDQSALDNGMMLDSANCRSLAFDKAYPPGEAHAESAAQRSAMFESVYRVCMADKGYGRVATGG